ncbi:MAG: flagellin [Burkholderiales bacterium]|nr:flagellin [Burkholderiales bacterium]
MTVINTNIKALYTQAALKESGRASLVAMQQLSTGKRINSSKDDAAGLAIAARMTQNIQGLNQSIRNSGDAISLIQVAEGATNEITTMLQRMSELAVQSSNSTYSTEQRGYLDQEFQQLKQEIVRISETHEWNGFPILNGKAGTPVGTPVSTTDLRAGVSASATGKTLIAGDLDIATANGTYAIRASDAGDDTKSSTVATSSSKAGSAIAIAAAINARIADTGVNATANSAVIEANKTTVGTTSIQTDLYVNGTKVPLSLTAGQTKSERRQYVIDSINALTSTHGVTAGDGGNGGLSLKTIDGRNMSLWYDNTSSIHGSDFGLGMDTATTSDPVGVTGIAGGPAATSAASVAASTVYGTVTLTSISAFTVQPGANALPNGSDLTYANFSALGFNSGTINPKNIGRLSFQVGPSPDQLISIDFADFGKNGDITGPITSDQAPTNILTVQAANDVTQSVNKSLDMIAKTRASMGAVMNRLEHVIDNLTNVVMNSEASRSQIEDADYASASTELARTQIMQQAATAVLAQANTSQQTVLKLLQQ